MDFVANDQGTFFIVYKKCLWSVNHEQFPMQMTQNIKHNKWLEILTSEDNIVNTEAVTKYYNEYYSN